MSHPSCQTVTPSDVVAVSAADSGYFGLARDLVSSLRCLDPNLHLAVFDLGLTEEQKAWLRSERATCLKPRLHFGLSSDFYRPLPLSLLVRPFLDEYLPGYEVYLWLDADAWVQDRAGLDRLIRGAREAGMAAVHEAEPAYRFQPWLEAWTWKHAVRGFGVRSAIRQRLGRQINGGVFGIARGAPHWRLWQDRFADAIRRTGRVAPYDQFALNEMIHVDRPGIRLLEPEDNWICDRALPVWDDARRFYVTPTRPHRPISIMHLAGPAKRGCHALRSLAGRPCVRALTFSAMNEHART